MTIKVPPFARVRALPIAIAIAIPTSAAATPKPLAANLACDNSTSCLQVTNTGSGNGVRAVAKANSASVGETWFALPKSPGAGIGTGGLLGLDLSGNAKSVDWTAGVYGYSKYGEGVFGASPFSDGVFAETANDGTKTGFGTNGVVGLDAAPDKSGFNNGVLGQSPYGYGVFGLGLRASDSVASVGVVGATFAASKNSKLPGGVVGIGVYGDDASSDGGIRNVGVLGVSNGVGVVAIGGAPPQPAGVATRPALRVGCVGGGDLITGLNFGTRADVFDFDCQGNLTLAGALTTKGTLQMSTALKSGGEVIAFAARTTRATIEDVGSGTLVNGSARVEFDASFAGAIDTRLPYLVFVTPNGDSRGLYVQKSAAGFIVRENDGGRATLGFDYRVVAKPLDAPSTRLASARSIDTLTQHDEHEDAAMWRGRLALHLPRSR
jgi:hypothetical protein